MEKFISSRNRFADFPRLLINSRSGTVASALTNSQKNYKILPVFVINYRNRPEPEKSQNTRNYLIGNFVFPDCRKSAGGSRENQ